MNSSLARCVPDPGLFRDRYWGREPWLCEGMDAGGYGDLLSIDDIDRLVAEGGLRHPALKLVTGGSRSRVAGYTRRATVGSVGLDDLIDPEAVRDAFAGGATIVLNSLHRHWPPLASFCDDLQESLSHPVQVNAYVTPADARGLDLHWDTHDVFVLQCFGEKHWEVYGEGFHAPLRRHHRKGAIDPPGEALISARLRPGDALYIPRGFVHAAETREHASAHLTVGILSVTWADALRSVAKLLEDDPAARESLPAGFAAGGPEALVPQLRERLEALREAIAALEPEALAAEVVERASRRRPLAAGTIAGVARLGTLDDHTRLVRRRTAVCRIAVSDGRATARTDTREIALPADLEDALAFALSGEPFAVGDLARWLDPRGRRVLAGRLLREGMLTISR